MRLLTLFFIFLILTSSISLSEQKTYQNPIATPADWQVGQDVIVALSLNDEQAKEKYGELDVKLPYLRTVKS